MGQKSSFITFSKFQGGGALALGTHRRTNRWTFLCLLLDVKGKFGKCVEFKGNEVNNVSFVYNVTNA